MALHHFDLQVPRLIGKHRKLENMRIYIVAIVVGLFLSNVAQAQKLEKKKVNDVITVYIPSDFVDMPEIDLIRKYPSVRKPLAAYTNMDRLVDFSVNQSATQWQESDLEMAKDFFKASLFNLYDEVEVLQEGIREVNGRKMAYFEFVSVVKGIQHDVTDKPSKSEYGYVQYVITKDGTWVFSFHAPTRMKEEWREVSDKMMTSIKVK